MIIKPLSIISLKVWLKLVTRGDPCRPLRGKVALKVHQVALPSATSASPILSSGCSKGFISTALYQLHPHTEHSDQGGLYCTFQLLHLRTDFPHFSHASNPRQCSTQPSRTRITSQIQTHIFGPIQIRINSLLRKAIIAPNSNC